VVKIRVGHRLNDPRGIVLHNVLHEVTYKSTSIILQEPNMAKHNCEENDYKDGVF
jgi:hypothetical protein